MSAGLALSLALVTAPGLAAQRLPEPAQDPQERMELGFDLPAQDEYGDPAPVDLWDLARSRERYQKRAVITAGYVEPFEAGYLRLTERGASVVLIGIGEGLSADIREYWGRRVEITGVVRRLLPPQPPCGPLHWSVCEDPALPQLPDLEPARSHWPQISLTFWAVVDAAERGRKEERGSGSRLLEEIAGSPADYTGTTVTVVGQFRGHNLFGDLPDRVWGRDDDWVLRSGEGAVWVTGKKPRGKGWGLELDYEPDSRFWLEVTGEVVLAGGVACIKAKQVALAKDPR